MIMRQPKMLDNSNVKDIKVYLSYFWCLFSYSIFF